MYYATRPLYVSSRISEDKILRSVPECLGRKSRFLVLSAQALYTPLPKSQVPLPKARCASADLSNALFGKLFRHKPRPRSWASQHYNWDSFQISKHNAAHYQNHTTRCPPSAYNRLVRPMLLLLCSVSRQELVSWPQ